MKKILITKNLLPVIIISIVFINQNSIARANCAGFTIAHSICMASKSSDDPTASTLCTIEAGAQCDQIDRRQKVTPPLQPES